MATDKIATDDLKSDVETAGVQRGIPVEVRGMDGSKTFMTQEEVIKGIAYGNILSNSPDDFYVIQTFPKDSMTTNVSRTISFPAKDCEAKKTPTKTGSTFDAEKFKKFEEETSMIRKVLKNKKTSGKWNLEISEPVTLTTYKTLFEGDKIDVMQQHFTGGEQVTLVGVFTPTDAVKPYLKYQFKLSDKTFFDLDEDRCYDYINNFEKVFDSVEDEKVKIQKAKKKRETEAKRKAEEDELQKIVAQVQRESRGSGSWS